MYYKFTKLAKNIIIINIVLTLLIVAYHGYNVNRINETQEIIMTAMAEQDMSREIAIEWLLQDGVDLYLGQEFATFFGLFMSAVTLILVYKYSRTNGFFFGFFAAVCAVFTTLIGGFLLFYLILYGRVEIDGNPRAHSLENKWEKYIHNRSDQIDAPNHKV